MKGEVVIATANKKLFLLVLLCKIYSMHFYDFFLMRPMGAKGLTLVQALRGRVGAKGCWMIFF